MPLLARRLLRKQVLHIMLSSIIVLVAFPFPGAMPGLTIRREVKGADKKRERDKQEDEWWHATTPFSLYPGYPAPRW